MAQESTFAGKELASWGRRVSAWILDILLLGVLLTMAFFFFGSMIGTDGSPLLFVFLIVLAWIGVPTIYWGLSMARGERNGQSPGKQMVGIAVIREDGAKVDFRYAFRRQVLLMQLLFWTLLGGLTFGAGAYLNYFWPLWDDRRQALHDKMAGSRVVLTS